MACLGIVVLVFYAPTLTEQTYGAPEKPLSGVQEFSSAVELLIHTGDLTVPVDRVGSDQDFTIDPGESVRSISTRLQQAGLIRSSDTFRTYLLWKGADTSILPGTYRLNPGMTAIQIAERIRSKNLTEVPFTVLAGWRVEEIAGALPTSGLSISPQDFLNAAAHPASPPFFLPTGAGAEGFFYPDHYQLSRTTTADELVAILLKDFSDHLTPDLRSGFTLHGLTVYQAVTLASIVERETVSEEEMPVIASVFYNRLAAGMKLESDPTVQYALGYNAAQGTWWTNPLRLTDLKIDSPYNTYVYSGLPPAPIANPGPAALQAVAFPANTKYLYFRARCDGSGLHNFAETFESHLKNSCP